VRVALKRSAGEADPGVGPKDFYYLRHIDGSGFCEEALTSVRDDPGTLQNVRRRV
jgi:hypothetical protein